MAYVIKLSDIATSVSIREFAGSNLTVAISEKYLNIYFTRLQWYKLIVLT